MGGDLEDARRRYGWALAPEDQARLPFYAGLVRAFGEDPVALELLASVRIEQRNPMLVLAALHYLALEGHPVLGPVYDDVRHGRERPVEEVVAIVTGVLHDDPGAVRAQLHRSTQTNEPGRSAVLRAALPHAVPGARRVNLVDIGTSAGVNLFLDRYRVAPADDGDPLTLVCHDTGPIDRSRALPAIVTRVGIDQNPLDLADVNDQRWLEACVWPEERRRFERLDAIVRARPTWPAITLLRGDALERLDDALDAGDPDADTVVMNSWFVPYLERDAQALYYERLCELCERGRVAWISLEMPASVNWPTTPGSTAPPMVSATEVMVTRAGQGPAHFGWCHPHGRWLVRDDAAASDGRPH